MDFWSPTSGNVTLDEVVSDMISYVNSSPNDVFRIIIGTDSQTRGNRWTQFVTVIIVHHVGKGARTYLSRSCLPWVKSLRQKIYTEAAMSLQTCSSLTERLHALDQTFNLEIHLDVGNQGATKTLVKEVVGWVTHSGFQAVIKPDSFGASKVADRYARENFPFAR